MAKLYFKYGVVNSSKSANALMTIHNYEEQGMSVYTMKSSIDTRDYGVIKSRAIGSKKEVDMLYGRYLKNTKKSILILKRAIF